MRKLIVALAMIAAGPAMATGLDIVVEGEGANGTIHVDLLEDVAPGHVERIAALARKRRL